MKETWEYFLKIIAKVIEARTCGQFVFYNNKP